MEAEHHRVKDAVAAIEEASPPDENINEARNWSQDERHVRGRIFQPALAAGVGVSGRPAIGRRPAHWRPLAHRMRNLPVPVDANVVRLAVRRAIRARAAGSCPGTLAGLRDAALISVGYDTLCRSSERSAMRVEHIRFDTEGSASLLIPRTKSIWAAPDA
ncbi:MAG: hypothetical protein ABI645_10330 [Pseudomonadota bacterium]